MSHEIAKTADGRDAIAYVGATPWHGLGQRLEVNAPLETWAAAAGFDWTCEIIPSMYLFGGSLVTSDNFHMVRSDNGASLSVMSSRYKPVQPADVLAFFRDFVLLDPRFSLETAGVLKGGRVLWALARFVDNITVAGDSHAIYCFITTSFDGTLATRIQATWIRVVCNNTLSAAVAVGEKAVIKVPHYRDFSAPSVQADAADRFAAILEATDKYKVLGDALAGVRLAAFQIEGLFKRLTVDKAARGDAARELAPTTKARNQLEAMLASYRATLNEGTPGGTAWAVFNGVTRYVDHARTTRDTSGDGVSAARMSSALLGSGAVIKREALNVLAEIGGLQLAA